MDDADFETEMQLIAQQTGQSLRKTRARLEKTGQMDAIRNQIVERKVIELVVENAEVTEEEVSADDIDDQDDSFPVTHSVLGTKDDSIPEAKYEDNSVPGATTEKDKE